MSDTEPQSESPRSRRRRSSITRAVGIRLIVYGLPALLLFYLLFPVVDGRPPARRRLQCLNNLKQVTLALTAYNSAHGLLPPAYIADENGRPMHSWRVLILPYLDQQALYEKYRFDEPWDGPHNKKLSDVALPIFQCPEDETSRADSPTTNYLVVVGPNTVWPGRESVNLEGKDVPDGNSRTLLIVEVADSGIHWMEPRDLHVEQMARTINPKSGQGISSRHPASANVAFCDGHCESLPETLPADTIRRMLERNDGEPVGEF